MITARIHAILGALSLASFLAVGAVNAAPCAAQANPAAQPSPAAQPAPTASATSSYLWGYNFKKGDVARYRDLLQVNGSIPGGDDLNVSITAIYKHEVTDVTPAGDSVSLITVEKQTTMFNAAEVPDDPTTHTIVTQTVTKAGIVRSQKTENSAPGTESLQQLQALINSLPIPDRAVKTGDVWKTDINNGMVPGKKVTAVSTLVGPEKLLGLDTLRVTIKMVIPTTAASDAKKAITLNGAYNVDPATGTMIRADYILENVVLPTPAGDIPVKMNMKIVRIVPGVNDKDNENAAATQDTGKTKP